MSEGELGKGVYGSDVTRKENEDWAAGKGELANETLNQMGRDLGRENPIAPETPADEETQQGEAA